jgi:hypothetical protein
MLRSPFLLFPSFFFAILVLSQKAEIAPRSMAAELSGSVYPFGVRASNVTAAGTSTSIQDPIRPGSAKRNLQQIASAV